MKRILLPFLVVMLTIASSSYAQTFTLQSDTVYYTTANSASVHNNITNVTSNPMPVTWKVVDHNFPASWTSCLTTTPFTCPLGVCDNFQCYNNQSNNALINGNPYTSLDYTPNVAGDFHLQLDLTYGVGGTYYITFNLVGGAYNRNTTFIITKDPTGVANTNNAPPEVSVYPNPAKDYVNVVFNQSLGVKNIAIYNLIGKMINTYKVNGASAKLDLSSTPSGIYFVRMMNAQGQIVATRKFTHQ